MRIYYVTLSLEQKSNEPIVWKIKNTEIGNRFTVPWMFTQWSLMEDLSKEEAAPSSDSSSNR